MTAAEFILSQSKKGGVKRVKGAKRTTLDGIKFDSALEARRWAVLGLRQRAGEIRDLKRQVKIKLLGLNGPILTPTGREMTYLADFAYHDIQRGMDVIEDTKGFETEVFKIKRAILAAQGIQIEIVR